MRDGFTNRSHWLAGELAKAAGVSTDTLRHYERKGVLKRPVRASNGYRLYPENALNRVLLIRRALSVGFTLDELSQILSERDKGGAPCRKVRTLVAEKLSDVEEQLIVLANLRDELKSTLIDWDQRLSAAKSDSQVGLLDSLVSTSNGQNQPLTETKKKVNVSPKLKFKKKGSVK